MTTISTFDGPFEFLSNFHQRPFEFEGIVYPTSEHAFQACKTDDQKIRQAIADCKTPQQAKRAGSRRGIVKDLRPSWDIVRVAYMEKVLRAKFADPELQVKLIETGDRELIEGNTWNDTFWGVCRGKGSNWLGKTLMKIRKSL